MPRRNDKFDFEYDIDLARGGDSVGKVSVFGRFPAGGKCAENAKTVARKTPWGVGNLWADAERLNLTLHTADQDPKLPQFSPAFDAEAMSERLSAYFRTPPSQLPRCGLITYRPGRRFVVRYTAGGEGIIAKFFADDRGRRIAELHRRLDEHLNKSTEGRIGLPEIFEYDAGMRMLATRWIDAPIGVASSVEPDESADRTAAVLAALHSAPADGVATFDDQEYRRVLTVWRDAIRRFLPSLADRSETLYSAVASAHPGTDVAQPVVLHRDFYGDQLLIGRDRATLLDLDLVSLGDQCLDLGNELAHRLLSTLIRERSVEIYSTTAGRMLEAYERRLGRVDDGRLTYYWAASLYRVGAIHAFRDGTSEFTRALWDWVEPVLGIGRDVLGFKSLQVPPRD